MACDSPFLRKIKMPYEHFVLTPCGHCPGCNKDRVNMWSDRCLFECLTNERASALVTLTYNDQHLPKDRGVHYEDVRAFNLRLRKNLGRSYKYWVSSEYGSDGLRPHYHLILFGFDVGVSEDMKALYNAWSPYGQEYGFFEADYLTSGRIRYALKYVTKEYGKEAEEYASLGLPPLFHTMSKGIGKQWFLDNIESIRQNHGYYIDGVLRPLPRYYAELLDALYPDDVRFKRSLKQEREMAEKAFQKTEKKVSWLNMRDVASLGTPQEVNNLFARPMKILLAAHKEQIADSKKIIRGF